MHEQRAGPNQAIKHRADHGRGAKAATKATYTGWQLRLIQADAHSTIHPFREATKLWRSERVVVEQKRFGDFLTAPPGVQKHQGVRTPSHPATRRPIARQHDQLAAILFVEETRLNHARNTIRPIGKRKKFLPALQ